MDNLLIKRIKATLIDIAIVAVPTLFVELVFVLLKLIPAIRQVIEQLSLLEPKQLAGLFMLMYFIYDAFYNMKFHTTIGKSRMKIHVETNAGYKRIPTKYILIRSGIKAISLFTLYAFPAGISVLMMTNDYGTSLQDKIARTCVWENMVG